MEMLEQRKRMSKKYSNRTKQTKNLFLGPALKKPTWDIDLLILPLQKLKNLKKLKKQNIVYYISGMEVAHYRPRLGLFRALTSFRP